MQTIIFCFDIHRYANNNLIFTKKKCTIWFQQVYVEYYHLSPIMDSVSLVCKEEMQSGDVRPLVGTWLISGSGVRFWSDWYHPYNGSLPVSTSTICTSTLDFHTMYFHPWFLNWRPLHLSFPHSMGPTKTLHDFSIYPPPSYNIPVYIYTCIHVYIYIY